MSLLGLKKLEMGLQDAIGTVTFVAVTPMTSVLVRASLLELKSVLRDPFYF